MAIPIDVNGQTINYPQIGDTNWADEATDFAVQTASAFGKLGLDIGTSVDIPGTLDVTGATTLDSTLTVAGTTTLNGTANLNGNTNLGNAITDIVAVTAILNVDAGVLYVDPSTNKVGINDTTPSEALDVTGNVAITGNETVGGTLGVTGNVAVNTNKFNVTASSGDTLIAGTLGVTGAGSFTSNLTSGGVIYADDETTANTPVLSFTGDTNTGIGRSAADTLDLITGGNTRFRIESTGQIKAVYESQVGTDYNTTLNNGYFCRAWAKFTGVSSTTLEASGNVTSVTYNTTGDYTLNFTVAMPDVNYAYTAASKQNGVGLGSINYPSSVAVGSLRIVFVNTDASPGARDQSFISVVVFR